MEPLLARRVGIGGCPSTPECVARTRLPFGTPTGRLSTPENATIRSGAQEIEVLRGESYLDRIRQTGKASRPQIGPLLLGE